MRKYLALVALLLVAPTCGTATKTTTGVATTAIATGSGDESTSSTAAPSGSEIPESSDAATESEAAQPSVAPTTSAPSSIRAAEEPPDLSDLLAFFDAQAPPGVTDDQTSAVRAVIQRARWAVVDILYENMGQGTGTFISSDGYLVTAGHVATGDGNYSVVTYDGRKFPAKIIARNVSYAPDLAILKVDGNGFPFVPIGSTPSKGDIAIYVGHPFTLLWAGFGGVITDIDSSQAFDQILYTNPSDSGASGSTILNLNGDLIGVLSGERGFPLPTSVLAGPQQQPL